MNNADKSAYPVHPQATSTAIEGLTKRERFAMAAMQAYLSDDATKARINSIREDGDTIHDVVAELSIQMADTLLAELEKTEES